MAYLILIRHGLTDWNIEGRWQGLTDTSLSEQGRQQAKDVAKFLQGMNKFFPSEIKIDRAYTSKLKRTKQTYQEIANFLKLDCPVSAESALDERDYGIYTAMNKWEVKKQLGEEAFFKLRRGWNQPVPEGESLKDVYERVVPFYQNTVLKELKEEKNVLIVSSGNTLRALLKYLEDIPEDDVAKLEFEFDQVLIFDIDSNGKILSKKARKT